jgi:dihydropteroate synthase
MAKILGILNVTPDSFWDGGKHTTLESAVAKGLEMESQGADIIDIGGESTRPGADPVSEQEELERVIPVIQELTKLTKLPLSIDTMKPKVAKEALKAGASIINDVSGLRDKEMIAIAQDAKQIIVMHMLGNPKTMQHNPSYPEGIIPHLLDFADTKIEQLEKAGIQKNHIIFDPGIGFGKTIAQNLEIIHNLPVLKGVGVPILIGASRKSFLGKVLNKPKEALLSASVAIHTVAVLLGAAYIRVHDVSQSHDAIKVLSALKAGL